MLNNSEQYKPFSAKEERKFINDNIDNLEYVKSELIKRNIRLVISMSRKYALTTDNYDDLLQNGFYGLVKAADKFDYTANNRFCTYAGFWIRKYLLSPFYDKYDSKIKYNAFNLDIPQKDKDSLAKNNNISLMEAKVDPCYDRAIEDIDKSISATDMTTLVNAISSNVNSSTELSALDKSVYNLCLLQQYTVKDACKSIKSTPQEITRSKRKINQYIKNFLKTKYNISEYSDIN